MVLVDKEGGDTADETKDPCDKNKMKRYRTFDSEWIQFHRSKVRLNICWWLECDGYDESPRHWYGKCFYNDTCDWTINL